MPSPLPQVSKLRPRERESFVQGHSPWMRMLRFELGIECPQFPCTTHNMHDAQMANDSVFTGKIVYNPSWMGHTECQKRVECILGMFQRKPRAVFYSYHKGELWGFISSLTLSPRCSSLRYYHEKLETHRKIFKGVMTGSINTDCEHACHLGHCQPWRYLTGWGRPVPGLLPGIY